MNRVLSAAGRWCAVTAIVLACQGWLSAQEPATTGQPPSDCPEKKTCEVIARVPGECQNACEGQVRWQIEVDGIQGLPILGQIPYLHRLFGGPAEHHALAVVQARTCNQCPTDSAHQRVVQEGVPPNCPPAPVQDRFEWVWQGPNGHFLFSPAEGIHFGQFANVCPLEPASSGKCDASCSCSPCNCDCSCSPKTSSVSTTSQGCDCCCSKPPVDHQVGGPCQCHAAGNAVVARSWTPYAPGPVHYGPVPPRYPVQPPVALPAPPPVDHGIHSPLVRELIELSAENARLRAEQEGQRQLSQCKEEFVQQLLKLERERTELAASLAAANQKQELLESVMELVAEKTAMEAVSELNREHMELMVKLARAEATATRAPADDRHDGLEEALQASRAQNATLRARVEQLERQLRELVARQAIGSEPPVAR